MMRLRLGVLAALIVAFALPVGAVPLAMSIETNGGAGAVTFSETPGRDMRIHIVGSDNGFGLPEGAVETRVSFLYGGDAPFDLNFNWQFETVDWASLDPFGYFLGNTRANLTTLCNCTASQSGTFSFIVNPGTTFGFYIMSWDNAGGPAQARVEIAEGVIPSPAPIPLPASAALMLPGLGALAFVRRRKRSR